MASDAVTNFGNMISRTITGTPTDGTSVSINETIKTLGSSLSFSKSKHLGHSSFGLSKSGKIIM